MAVQRRSRDGRAPRQARVERKTKETRVSVTVALDGVGQAQVNTGVGMLDHLIEQIAQHGLFDITLSAEGDLRRDVHHTVEDVGISLGQALAQALGDKSGIVRMGHALVPLDEALALVAVDISGRGYWSLELPWAGERVGDLPTDLIGHFLWALASEAGLTLHVRILSGGNDHHKAEAVFKALGRALAAATRPEPRLAGRAASTKGRLGK